MLFNPQRGHIGLSNFAGYPGGFITQNHLCYYNKPINNAHIYPQQGPIGPHYVQNQNIPVNFNHKVEMNSEKPKKSQKGFLGDQTIIRYPKESQEGILANAFLNNYHDLYISPTVPYQVGILGPYHMTSPKTTNGMGGGGT